MWPQPPLLPATARDRARVRALAQLIACDVHRLKNLRVMQYLERDWGVPQPEREVWSRHWMAEGFAEFAAARTSVVSRKSVCVRVDHSGRRNLPKKLQ